MDDPNAVDNLPLPAESKHDPLMTAFVVMIVGMLLILALLIIIANGRPPAGL